MRVYVSGVAVLLFLFFFFAAPFAAQAAEPPSHDTGKGRVVYQEERLSILQSRDLLCQGTRMFLKVIITPERDPNVSEEWMWQTLRPLIRDTVLPAYCADAWAAGVEVQDPRERRLTYINFTFLEKLTEEGRASVSQRILDHKNAHFFQVNNARCFSDESLQCASYYTF